MKRNLSAAFSTKALLEQESIVNSCADAFIKKIGEQEASKEQGLNMTKWYEMISFDILGEMAFGESFHAVQQGTIFYYPGISGIALLTVPLGKPHFWSELILDHLFFITVLDNLRRYPFFVTLGKIFLPFATVSVRNKHSGYTRQQVDRFVYSQLNIVSIVDTTANI